MFICIIILGFPGLALVKRGAKMLRLWTAEEQIDLFQRLGYDRIRWDPNNPEEVSCLACLARNALLDGRDKNGEFLSPEDFQLLAVITNSH